MKYNKKTSVVLLLSLFFTTATFSQVGDDEQCNGSPQVISGDYVELCDYRTLAGATSSLKDKKKPQKYMPDKALDGKLNTTWVEGRKGDGIGEKIAFKVPPGKTKIRIIPGFAIKKYFSKNNRVKKARLTIFYARNYFDGGTYCKTKEFAATLACFYGQDRIFDEEITFKDSMEFQEFTIPAVIKHGKPPAGIKYQKGYVGVLEILEVYKGSKWKDTCISEIQFK